MRWMVVAVALLPFAFTSLNVQANEKSPSKAASEPLAKIIEKLGSRDYKTRETAAKAIESLGIESLPQLRKALAASTSAEIRKRLSSLVQALERAEILSPKRLTLQMADRPVSDIVNEIKKQTGYPIQNLSGMNPRITLQMRNATFWEVMDRLCLLGGFTVYYNEGQGLVLSYNDYFTPCVAYCGPFKVVANNFSYNKTINFGPLPRNPANHQLRNESLTFSFTVHSEPKLPIMNVGQPRVLEAIDDAGASMAPTNSNQYVTYHNYGGYRTLMHGQQINLLWPNKSARLVKRLRVILPVTLLSEQKPEIVVENLLKVKNAKFTGSNSELQVLEVKETNNKTQFQVKVIARNKMSNAAHDYSWANTVPQRIEVHDAKGNKLFSHGYNYESSSQGSMQATFMFGTNGDPKIGPAAKLVFNHWATMSHDIEFEFKDLALP